MLARNEAYTDLSRPSAKGLAFALRHPEVWPKGFKWFYPDCKRCAIGLAYALWPETNCNSFDVLAALGVTSHPGEDEWHRHRSVFFNGNSETTPQEVAERIDQVFVD